MIPRQTGTATSKFYQGHSTLSQSNPCLYVSVVQVLRENCWKRRNCLERTISPFSTVFSTVLENFPIFHQLKNWRLQTPSVWKNLKFVVWERIDRICFKKIVPEAEQTRFPVTILFCQT